MTLRNRLDKLEAFAGYDPHDGVEDEELRCLRAPHEIALAIMEREDEVKRKGTENGHA